MAVAVVGRCASRGRVWQVARQMQCRNTHAAPRLAPGLEAAPGEAHDPALEGGKRVGGGQREDGLVHAHVAAGREERGRREEAGGGAQSAGSVAGQLVGSRQAHKADKAAGRPQHSRPLTQRSPCGDT